MRITFSVSLAAATAYSRLGESDMHEKGLTDPSVNEATTADVDMLHYSFLLLINSHLLSCEKGNVGSVRSLRVESKTVAFCQVVFWPIFQVSHLDRTVRDSGFVTP